MADPVDDAVTPDSTHGTPSDDPPSEAAAAANTGPIEEHTTERRTLSPSVQLIWAVRLLFGVVIFGVVGGFTARQFDFDLMFVLAGVVVLTVLGLIWVHLRYRIWSFRVREDALYLERGVLTNVKTVAPHVRIQHVDTARGPFERALGLSTLVVYTAGSRGADVSIPGLTTEEAADLQTRVKELAIAADGGDAL